MLLSGPLLQTDFVAISVLHVNLLHSIVTDYSAEPVNDGHGCDSTPVYGANVMVSFIRIETTVPRKRVGSYRHWTNCSQAVKQKRKTFGAKLRIRPESFRTDDDRHYRLQKAIAICSRGDDGHSLPMRPCPECGADRPRFLEDVSRDANVNYYECSKCRHVWHVTKADVGGTQIPVTQPTHPDSKRRRTA